MLFIYFNLCKFAKFLVSFLKAQVNSSLNFELFLISMTHNSSINNTVIPFLLWTKWPQQSPNFETPKCSGENLPNFSCHFSNHQSVSLFNASLFCITLQCHQRWLLCTFFGSNIIYFPQKEYIKVKIFETFQCSGQNLPNSLWEFWNDNSIPL